MNKNKKNQTGVILLLTLFILTGILVIALSAADLVFAGIKMNRLSGYSGIAFFAAEAGMERALWEGRTWQAREAPNPLPENDMDNLFSGVLSNGSSYTVNYAMAAPYIVFTSIGDYHGAKRSVEGIYEAD